MTQHGIHPHPDQYSPEHPEGPASAATAGVPGPPPFAAPAAPHHGPPTQPLDPRGTAFLPPPVPPAPGGPRPGGSARAPGKRIAELSVVALLAAGLASGGTFAATRLADSPAATRQAAGTTQGSSSAPVLQANGSAPDWAATAKAVAPSVVSIIVEGRQGSGQGSGVIIDKAGHVLTNNHVAVGGGSNAALSVTLNDGRTYAAKVVGTDPSTDLAVLALDRPPADLTPISFGDSSKVAVGDPVMAVGNPLGLAGTVTTGIVSALNRPVTTSPAQSPNAAAPNSEPVVTNAIQTSAAINPGNSGGALVTAGGQLIGINSSIASLGASGGQSGNIGIGFAIPGNEAKSIADQLIASGSAQHAYLGVSSSDTTATEGSSKRAAALVKTVAPGTPAASAGLKDGDAVVAIDGKPIDSSLSLVATVREHNVGDTVTLTILRGGQRLDVKVTLAARPGQ